MNTYGGEVTQLHVILISAPDAAKWLASRPGHRTPVRRAPVTLNMRLAGPPQVCLSALRNQKPLAPTRNQTRFLGRPGCRTVTTQL